MNDPTQERTVRTVTETSYRLVEVPAWVKRATLDHTLPGEVQLQLERRERIETASYRYGSTGGALKRYAKHDVKEVGRSVLVIPAGSVVQYLRSQESKTICFISDVRLADGRLVQVAFDQDGSATRVRLTSYGQMAI